MDDHLLPTADDAGAQTPMFRVLRRHRWLWVAALVVAIVKTVPPVSGAAAVPLSVPGTPVAPVPAGGAAGGTLRPDPVWSPLAPDAFAETLPTATSTVSPTKAPDVWPTSAPYGGTATPSPSPTPDSTPGPLPTPLPSCIGPICVPPGS